MEKKEKKNRDDLKVLFKQGAKPSGTDFANLIDSMLNSLDDGIEKPGDQPRKIKALDSSGKILEMSGADDQLQWSIALKSNDKAGLNFLNTDLNSKLFLDASGKLGVDTANPKATLHVNGDGKITGPLRAKGSLSVTGKAAFSDDLTAAKALKVTGDTTLSGALSVGKNVAINGNLKVKGGASSLQQEDWQEAKLINGWQHSNFPNSTCRYFKDSHGVVHLEGIVALKGAKKKGSGSVDNTKPITVLPETCWPANRALLFVVVIDQNTCGSIVIEREGQVHLNIGVACGSVSLDGITFRAK